MIYPTGFRIIQRIKSGLMKIKIRISLMKTWIIQWIIPLANPILM
jgi:hypothetical protein